MQSLQRDSRRKIYSNTLNQVDLRFRSNLIDLENVTEWQEYNAKKKEKRPKEDTSLDRFKVRYSSGFIDDTAIESRQRSHSLDKNERKVP